MRPRPAPLPWAVVLLFGFAWAFLPLFRSTADPAPPLAVEPELASPDVSIHMVETTRAPLGPMRRMLKANLSKPISEMYFPPLPPSLYLRNLPCVGIRDWPVPPPKPLPANPRFALLIDSWERQQTGLKTVENAATIAEKFDLVFVMPNVRMSNIQGLPGWTQWKSGHAMDGFTAAKYLLPMWEYFDLEFTRGMLPLISFEDFVELNNYTITTALMLDWLHDNCQIKPEWFPAYGARIQATQLYCMPHDFPSAKLSRKLVDKWLTPGSGRSIPESEGRPPPKYPSVAFLNWRKNSFGSHDWANELWGGKCRFRWARKWNQTAVAWAKEHLPDRYVAIKIRSGNWLRWFWLPKRIDDVKVCFDQMAEAAKFYMRQMGLPDDAPVYLSTEWPNPPESRWHFEGVSIMTASFNSLYRQLNLVSYRNKAYDIGIVTIISFNLLINAAMVIAFEDTMMEFARMYNPQLQVAIVGTQTIRKCNIWNPPKPGDPPAQFLYLVQGKKFLEKPRFSDNSDVLCLTWGEPASFCDHQPGTTWTSGRNALWAKAVQLKRRYEYYIFLDEDVFLVTPRKFETMLMKWRPAVGVPGWAVHYPQPWGPPKNQSEALQITGYQAFINAFHHDVMFSSVVLPYYDGMDQFSWWTSQLYTIYLTGIFHPDEVYGFQLVQAGNDFSGEYPKRWDLNEMNKPFLQECIRNETFRKERWKGFVIEAAEVKMPKPSSRRHAMPEAELQHFLQQNTVYWSRIRQLRRDAGLG